ncbi:hypothetical protein DVQ50_17110 [Yersinia enterocolitica]|nr:hypothetical protein [Yersinia enterocolitica]
MVGAQPNVVNAGTDVWGYKWNTSETTSANFPPPQKYSERYAVSTLVGVDAGTVTGFKNDKPRHKSGLFCLWNGRQKSASNTTSAIRLLRKSQANQGPPLVCTKRSEPTK